MSIPAFGKRRRDTELVKHTRHDMVDNIVDRFRMVVKSRHRRNYCFAWWSLPGRFLFTCVFAAGRASGC